LTAQSRGQIKRIKFIFATFAPSAVSKTKHRKARQERKVFLK